MSKKTTLTIIITLGALAVLIGGYLYFEKTEIVMKIEPRQCLNNPWEEEYKTVTDENIGITDEERVKNYYKKTFQVDILEYESVPQTGVDVTCNSCDCPRGDIIKVKIKRRHQKVLLNDGWKRLNDTKE